MLTSAFILGLAGSLHCLGMCGPLMLALHGPPQASAPRNWASMAQYQAGRILTYSALGLFFGLAGKGMALAGMQQIISIAAGILMIAFAFMAWRIERIMNSLPIIQKLVQAVQGRMSGLLGSHPYGASFTFGMLNGLIPCGMVYAALAGAIASADAVGGAAFMAFFGLGTAPLMMAAGVLGNAFGQSVRTRFRTIQPILLLVSGALLIQRGLHLDLSLFQSAVPPADMDCH